MPFLSTSLNLQYRYAREQEELYEEAVGLRERLIKAYDRALAIKN
jgi:hypothetical protein